MKRELPAPLRAMCRSLMDIMAGRPAPPPVLCVDSLWGRFHFTAALLHGQKSGDDGHIAITVNYHEPRAVALMRNMWSLGLSETQKQLCLTLVENNGTDAQIAGRMGVSPTTVRDHLAKIYRKLNLHCQEDSLKMLSAPPGEKVQWH